MVTPNTDSQVIARGLGHGLEVMPGFLTPTEAFAALRAGARRLKLFPAAVQGVGYLKAVREVLPGDVGVWAVGGVDVANAADWLGAGAGFWQ
jgi:2-dehydro-3-deoxyphosphogalactonate aldolase